MQNGYEIRNGHLQACSKRLTMKIIVHERTLLKLANTIGEQNSPVPVAQLVSVGLRVVRAHVQVAKVRGSRRDGRLIFMSILAGTVAVGGRPQLGEVGRGPAVRGYVRIRNIQL